MGIHTFPPAPNWAFPSGKQRCLDLCDPRRSDPAYLSKPRQQMARAASRSEEHAVLGQAVDTCIHGSQSKWVPPFSSMLHGHRQQLNIGCILITTHSVCQKISLYRVEIAWQPAVYEPKSNQFPTPSFRIFYCKVDMPGKILNANGDLESHAEQQLPFLNPVYSLTHLETMPGQIESPGGSTAKPWIMAVYSKPLHVTAEHPDQQGPPSVIVRWSLEAAPQAFHPKFDEVTSKKSNAQIKVRKLSVFVTANSS